MKARLPFTTLVIVHRSCFVRLSRATYVCTPVPTPLLSIWSLNHNIPQVTLNFTSPLTSTGVRFSQLTMTDAPANTRTPKAEALILYQLAGLVGPFPCPTYEHIGPSHNPLFTWIVTSQLTGESYLSGTYTEGPINQPFIDAAGVVYYARKRHTEDAAYARLMDDHDCRRQEFLTPDLGRDKIRTTRRCLQNPSLLPQHGNIDSPSKVRTPIPQYISPQPGLEVYRGDFIIQFTPNYGKQNFSLSIFYHVQRWSLLQ